MQMDRYKYEMNHPSRGTAVIIDNSFKDSKVYFKRDEHSVDVISIQNRLRELGFDTDIKTDMSKDQMIALMHETGIRDHTNSDCFMCVIMSYGEEGLLYGNDGNPVEMRKLIEPFKGDKCRSLAGKPKIFLIQACPLRKQTVADAVGIREEAIRTIKIPVEADFLTVFSVVPGYIGWESGKFQNSWFIEALSQTMLENSDHLSNGKMDFLRLMTRVNSKVYHKFEENKETSIKLPCVTSLLTKLIYFPEKQC